MDEPSDGQLLDAFQRGDSHALSTLIARHQSALLRHARSLVGANGSHEDVVQEGMITMERLAPGFIERMKLRGAISVDFCNDVEYYFAGFQMKNTVSGVHTLFCRRQLIDDTFREVVLETYKNYLGIAYYQIKRINEMNNCK